MSSALLRVIFGADSSQRVVFSTGLPSTVTELESEIKRQCNIHEDFHLQFMDTLFENAFMKLTSMEEIQDKGTVKVIYTSQPHLGPDADLCAARCFSPLKSNPEDTSLSSDSTVILSSPQSTSSRSSWPEMFCVPRFSFDAELKLETACRVFWGKK